MNPHKPHQPKVNSKYNGPTIFGIKRNADENREFVDQLNSPASTARGKEISASGRKIRLFIKKYALVFGLGAILLTALIVLQVTGVTVIKNVNVVLLAGGEAQYINLPEIETQIEAKYGGLNFYTVSLDEITTDIKANSPYVESVKIDKLFPSTLKVYLVERIPSLAIFSAEKCIIIDSNRWVVELTEDSNSQACKFSATELEIAFVEINGEAPDFELNRQAPYFDGDELAVANSILAQFGYTVDYVRRDGEVYEFLIAGNRVVRYTTLEEWEIQHKRLIIVLGELLAQKVNFTSIDVRYQRPVFTR